DVVSSPDSYLIVEGVLNVGGATTIRISRSTGINSTGLAPELNAQVFVEGKDNTTRTVPGTGGGNYSSANLNLELSKEYRVRIRTTSGKEYLSAYVIARETPAIDSIGWRRDNEGVRLYVNTHDATNATRYYRWDYEETWEIQSYFNSIYIYNRNTNTIRERLFSELVRRGWKYNNSSSILLASSARLQSDIIFEAPLRFIGNNDEKLAIRYSILLRQYALDKEAYDFFELMKKNTESIGTIFDPQPSEIRGNISCVTDPDELVIGFITASTITEKRIFISNAQLPGWRYFESCQTQNVRNHPDSIKAAFLAGQLEPYDGDIPILPLYYYASAPTCVDVTKRGASLIQPSYW
ncbi:MAG TPA: DUF4249 domain-containing protein, partial [Chitinophagaceae bacterium]